MPSQTTLNDSILWYNVPTWADYGLAVPNFGDDGQTQNSAILDLCTVTGRNLAAIMFHPDSRQSVPPSFNTVVNIAQLCERARTILASRSMPSNRNRLPTLHAQPALMDFLVFPVPFFKVRNPWLKRWCELVLYALTDAYQHTENANSLDFSTTFAQDFGQYIARIYQQMAIELFQVPRATAEDPTFTLTQDHYKAYAPERYVTRVELIDTVPDLTRWPTEDSLKILSSGIPTSSLPVLPTWPGVGNVSKSANPQTADTASVAFPVAPLPGAPSSAT